MARYKKPNNLKRIQGTYRADRDDGLELEVQPEIPKCPPHLKGEARKEWNRITVELYKLGLITPLDRAALSAYCTLWATYVQCDKVIRANGLTVMGKRGIARRPEVLIRSKAMSQMREFLIQFGMTPVSRTRLNIDQDTTQSYNPFNDLGARNN